MMHSWQAIDCHEGMLEEDDHERGTPVGQTE